LLKLELTVHYLCPWSSLFVSTCGQKKTNCTITNLIETATEEDKSNVDSRSLWVFCSSESDAYLQLLSSFFLIQGVDFWFTFLQIFYHSLFSFSCASDILIHVHNIFNFNLCSCTLEHILANPIVFQYFVIIKTLEELYKPIFFQHLFLNI